MAVSLADGQLFHALYGDAELGQLFTDSAEIRAMLLVEGALARAQGKLGVIPEISAVAIHRASREVLVDPGAMATAVARDGVVVPAMVAAFREAIEAPEHAAFVHAGATSQDIQDSGLVLRLRRALDLIESRLRALVKALAEQAREHAETPMAARTRHQIATPTTLGARIAVWGMPVLRHLDRMAAMRPRLLVLSLAGASGNRAAFDGRGAEIAALMAEELGLATETVPWHAARDGIAEMAGVLALVNGTLAKMAGDLLMSAQIGDGLRAGAGGGSSTMPHKANPTGAEALSALTRQNLGLSAQVQAAMAHAQERDGAAWGQEMLALPGLIVGTGAALRHAVVLAQTLQVDPGRMAAVFDETQGLMMAEAASFALGAEIGLPEARKRVKAACRKVASEGGHLRAAVAGESASVDWDAVFSARDATGDGPKIARAFVEAAQGVDKALSGN